MLAVLRQRGFALLWVAGLVSIVGDWVLLVPLPLHVYSLTGSALATSATFIARWLPRVLLSSFVGVFVDRWDRKQTMVVADLSRVAIILALLTVQSADEVWIVYAVTFLESALAQFFDPAKSTLVPRLVVEEHRLAANSLDALTGALSRLIAPAAGGVLATLLGIGSVIVVDSASFLVSAILIVLIPLPRGASRWATETVEARHPLPGTSLWQQWMEGLSAVTRDRLAGTLVLVSGIANLGYGIVTVLMVVFVKETLSGGAEELGWIGSARGLGAISGGLAIGLLGKRIGPLRLVSLGLLAEGVLGATMYSFPSLPLALALCIASGPPTSGWMVSMQTLLQNHVANRSLGRVLGLAEAVRSLASIGGMALAGVVAGVVGVVPTLTAAAGLYCVAGLAALLGLPAKESPRLPTLVARKDE